MFGRRLFDVATILALIVATTTGAAAKTLVTSSEVRDDLVAQEPFTVSFTLEDHDGLFTSDANLVVIARAVGSTEELEFAATTEGDPLQWSAELALPTAGPWTLYVSEPTLGFRSDLDSISVAENPAASITRADMSAAITAATEPLEKQLTSMTGELDTLRKSIASLTLERDVLQKQVVELQSAPAASGDPGLAWWQAAGIGAASAMVVALVAQLATPGRIWMRRHERESTAAPAPLA